MKIRIKHDKDIYVTIYEDNLKLFGQGKTTGEAFDKLKRAIISYAQHICDKCEIRKKELEL